MLRREVGKDKAFKAPLANNRKKGHTKKIRLEKNLVFSWEMLLFT